MQEAWGDMPLVLFAHAQLIQPETVTVADVSVQIVYFDQTSAAYASLAMFHSMLLLTESAAVQIHDLIVSQSSLVVVNRILNYA